MRYLEPDRTHGTLMFLALPSQRVQFGQPAFISGAPGGDPIAQPILFPRDLAAELVLLLVFLIQDRIAPGLEGGKPLFEGACDATVEPDRCSRELFQQSSVVAYQDHSGAHLGQLPLQPLDSSQIEMVGRLVEQQDVGKRRQGARKCSPACLTA